MNNETTKLYNVEYFSEKKKKNLYNFFLYITNTQNLY